MRLPLKITNAGAVREQAAHSDVSVLAGKKILVCEDNDINMEIECALLQKAGMSCDTAANGEEGVRKFAESGEGYYDAILMDLTMPVMNGFDATREIRNLKSTDAASVPIIAMTANAFTEDIEKCLKAGMNAHIAKPIEPDRMYTVLARLIK